MKYKFIFLNGITLLSAAALLFLGFKSFLQNDIGVGLIEFFLFFLFIVLFYQLKNYADTLKRNSTKAETLKRLISSFDKNVIYSKTNLSGRITHVSEAFCKISGYNADELIGKHHNIIRHPDMPKEIFKDLWTTIQTGSKWQGEIKNKKKDGGYYWVISKVEPDYDSNSKHIGYISIREDITAHKEVEKLKDEIENINVHLEKQVNERIVEIIALNKDILNTQKEVVFTMGTIGESRSKETGNHVKRVAEYSKLLAIHSGIPEYEAEMLRQASPMHDIGKIAIPDAILNKPGSFNETEREVMNTHARLGYDMLRHSDKTLLKIAATVAHEHHEKWDGTGYPNALKGENIHIYGRITALADVFDALGSDRVYKKGWELESIFTLFKEQKGKHFDPRLVDIFFEKIDEFLEIRDKFKDQFVDNQ